MPEAGGVNVRGIISVCLQQGQQAPLAVQRHQVVTTTHVLVANEDLRHGASPSQGHHAVALFGQLVDAHLFNVLNSSRFEQLLGANTERANGGREHLDWRHDSSFFQR